jgi:hypothetical protein
MSAGCTCKAFSVRPVADRPLTAIASASSGLLQLERTALPQNTCRGLQLGLQLEAPAPRSFCFLVASGITIVKLWCLHDLSLTLIARCAYPSR